MTALVGENNQSILYICEEKSDIKGNGVHGRNSAGDYFTVLEGPAWDTESTGLAFSPDNRHMYISFQRKPGIIYDITRDDGYAFNGQALDIKYHDMNYQQ